MGLALAVTVWAWRARVDIRNRERDLARRGVTLTLARVNEQPGSLMRRAGFDREVSLGDGG